MPDGTQAGEEAGTRRDRQPLLLPKIASEIANLINTALDARDRQRRRERADTGVGSGGANSLGSSGQSSFGQNNTSQNNLGQNNFALGFGNDFNQVNASSVSIYWLPEDVGFFDPTLLDKINYKY